MKRFFRHNDGRTYPWSPHLEAARLSYLTLVEEPDDAPSAVENISSDVPEGNLGPPPDGLQVINLGPKL